MKSFSRWLLLPVLGLAMTVPAMAGMERANAGDRGRTTAREAREVHASSARVRADRVVRESRGAAVEHTPRRVTAERTKAQRIHADRDARVIRNPRHVQRHDRDARSVERGDRGAWHKRDVQRGFDAQDADLLRELDRPKAREQAERAARGRPSHRDFDRHAFDSRRFDSRSTLRHRRDFYDRHHDALRHHRYYNYNHGPRFRGSFGLGHFNDHGGVFYRRSWPTWCDYSSPYRSRLYYQHYYPRHRFHSGSSVNLWFRF